MIRKGERAMKTYSSISDLVESFEGIVELHGEGVAVQDPSRLRSDLIEEWLYNSLFNTDEEIVLCGNRILMNGYIF